MAAFEFKKIAGATYVAEGPVNIGLYDEGNGSAVLIDSGNDEESGRKLLRACEAMGLRIRLVLNTHSHADHCGGNAFIQSRSGCGIAASCFEAAFIEHPILEGSLLWGGSPPPQLRTKFLLAKPSRVTERLALPCSLPVGSGAAIQALPLPGHSPGMAGYRTPDDVFFAADALASPEILDKYQVFFVFDFSAHLATLDFLAEAKAERFVPSHAPMCADLGAIAAYNKKKIIEFETFVLESCVRALGFEELLVLVSEHFAIELNHTQYALVGSTLRSCLSWLAERQKLSSRLDAGRMVFERKALT